MTKKNKIEMEIDLPLDLIQWAEKVAKEKGITFDDVIEEAIKDFIENNPL